MRAVEAAGYEPGDILGNHVQRSRDELLEVAGGSTADTLADNVDTLVGEWQNTRPHQTAWAVI